MKKTIFIQIKQGGIISIVSNTEDVDIKILDHDWGYPQLQNYKPDSIMTDEGFTEFVKKETKNKVSIFPDGSKKFMLVDEAGMTVEDNFNSIKSCEKYAKDNDLEIVTSFYKSN